MPDLEPEREVLFEQGNAKADVSAKSGSGIEELFLKIAELAMKSPSASVNVGQSRSIINSEQKKRGC
jgi:hypothetical protein